MGLIVDRIIPQMVIEKMIEIFGEDNIANAEHLPKCFEHQIKIAKWVIDQDNNKPQQVSTVEA